MREQVHNSHEIHRSEMATAVTSLSYVCLVGGVGDGDCKQDAKDEKNG